MSERPLATYRAKRDPARTPEPFGRSPPERSALSGSGLFVVQQHSARRMHWDLRLEIDGVLTSWAIPRGPSLDAKEKRLAVQTEDHPLEYSNFEGVIPPGNYGAGAMIVWDRGSFHTVDGLSSAESVSHGKLDLEFHGHKLQGRWALVRIKGENGKNWLLIHKGKAPTAPDLVVGLPASVLSGLTVDELARGVTRTDALAEHARRVGAQRAGISARGLRPMLADTSAAPFSRPGWVFELKYDGVRVLAERDASGETHLHYRSGRDTTAVFPEIAQAVAHLPCEAFVIDGEIVALDEHGHASFELLQSRLGQSDAGAIARAQRQTPLLLMCFDLLGVAGYDCRGLTLVQRKKILADLVPRVGIARFADHIEAQGEALFAEAEKRGLEGVVAKKATSTYQSGRRSRDWLKIKVLRSADLVIVGYARGNGVRAPLGALMLAWRNEVGFVYAGNVGSGFNASTLDALTHRLASVVRRSPAFSGTPPGPKRKNVFVAPIFVAEVRYAETTDKGLLRQPVFVRLREDKTADAADCLPGRGVAEPQVNSVTAVVASEPELRLSNQDKLFWPEDGLTKGDLLHYYGRIWPFLAPYLRDRPVVLTRYPDGIHGKSFFQKNAPAFTPKWVKTQRIDDTDYFLCNDLRTLLYVINSGCIPIHVWSARVGALQRPDWAIVDLDPKGAPFEHVVRVARSLHTLAKQLQAPHFVKTSGQDGLHILFPLGAALTHQEARAFAEVLSRAVVSRHPDIATVARPLHERGGRVYVDYLQNGYGKTIAAPFSARPRIGAPVSAPLVWREVGARLDPGRFTIKTVPLRYHTRPDPMLAVLDTALDLPAVLARLQQHLK